MDGALPVNATIDLGKPAAAFKTPPVADRQEPQLQMAIQEGGPFALKRTEPHMHPPVHLLSSDIEDSPSI